MIRAMRKCATQCGMSSADEIADAINLALSQNSGTGRAA
jgi:hypothetical protein